LVDGEYGLAEGGNILVDGEFIFEIDGMGFAWKSEKTLTFSLVDDIKLDCLLPIALLLDVLPEPFLFGITLDDVDADDPECCSLIFGSEPLLKLMSGDTEPLEEDLVAAIDGFP
jgi:hypothetical protein